MILNARGRGNDRGREAMALIDNRKDSVSKITHAGARVTRERDINVDEVCAGEWKK